MPLAENLASADELAWAQKEEADYGIITGDGCNHDVAALRRCYGYTESEIILILLLREASKLKPTGVN